MRRSPASCDRSPVRGTTRSIPRSSPNPDAAWTFLQWIESPAIAKERALLGGSPTRVDVFEDPELLASLHARLAVVSVGRDNDYGHPATVTMALLRRAGMRVERTDQDGDVAVTVSDGRLGVQARCGR